MALAAQSHSRTVCGQRSARAHSRWPFSSCVRAHSRAAAGTRQAASASQSPAWQGERQRTKQELRQRLSNLAAAHGSMAAVLPGLPEEKAAIDALLQRLQQLPKADSMSLVPSNSAPSDAVLGEWELVYASNGTVVTRTPMAQALVAMGKALPGAGLSDIRQTIKRVAGNQGLEASNEVLLGLGPLGSWRLGIVGRWISQGDGASVRVVFDRVNVELAGVMGLPLPRWLPRMPLSFGSVDRQSRGGAEWVTTYCDDDMRIGKGKASGNVFLFFKRQPE